jgi:hypothetical protein
VANSPFPDQLQSAAGAIICAGPGKSFRNANLDSVVSDRADVALALRPQRQRDPLGGWLLLSQAKRDLNCAAPTWLHATLE